MAILIITIIPIEGTQPRNQGQNARPSVVATHETDPEEPQFWDWNEMNVDKQSSTSFRSILVRLDIQMRLLRREICCRKLSNIFRPGVTQEVKHVHSIRLWIHSSNWRKTESMDEGNLQVLGPP